MPTATSQACLIRNVRPLKRNELIGTINRVVYLHGYSASQDPVVDVDRSIAGWRTIFPQLQIITLSGRSGRWHIPLVEQPEETAKAVQVPY